MERRLYFLLPDDAHARSVVAKLETNGVERKYTHVIAAKGIDLEGLPLASPNQRIAHLTRELPGSATDISMSPRASGQASITKEINNHE